jgi:hypothetical protein
MVKPWHLINRLGRAGYVILANNSGIAGLDSPPFLDKKEKRLFAGGKILFPFPAE